MKTYNLLENDKFVEIINKQSRLIGIDHGKKNTLGEKKTGSNEREKKIVQRSIFLQNEVFF